MPNYQGNDLTHAFKGEGYPKKTKIFFLFNFFGGREDAGLIRQFINKKKGSEKTNK